MALNTEFVEVIAVPGDHNIVDAINPNTGLTLYGSKTLEQALAEYPGAVLMSYDAWREARMAQQNTPIEWDEVTAEQYDEMLCVLPPAAWIGGAFLVGEPDDHSAETGAPRFRAYRQRGEVYGRASRPMTVKEFRALAIA